MHSAVLVSPSPGPLLLGEISPTSNNHTPHNQLQTTTCVCKWCERRSHSGMCLLFQMFGLCLVDNLPLPTLPGHFAFNLQLQAINE